MKSANLSYFDEAYEYRGYVLVNELYPDDEGFNKNHWQWGRLEASEVIGFSTLKGLSSNSYSSQSEAYGVFKDAVDGLIKLFP